jgi:hypothetical protein
MKNTPYLRKIKEQSKGNLILSLNSVPYDHLDDLFSGGDIGLPIYSDSYEDNFRVLGSASGKSYQYIKKASR